MLWDNPIAATPGQALWQCSSLRFWQQEKEKVVLLHSSQLLPNKEEDHQDSLGH